MASPENSNSETSTRDQRVDPPHTLRPATAQEAKPVAASAASQADEADRPLALSAYEPMSSQAQQLAEWLKTQEVELEGRTSAVESTEGELQRKVEEAKQWLAEREAELEKREAAIESREAQSPDFDGAAALQQIAERQKELDARQSQLDEEAESLAEQRAAFADRVASLDARRKEAEQATAAAAKRRAEADEVLARVSEAAGEQQLKQAELTQLGEKVSAGEQSVAERERRLLVRQREIATALERYERLGITERRVHQLEEEATKAAERDRRLSDIESLLNEQRAELARRRTELNARHAEAVKSLDIERQAFAEERAAWLAEAKVHSQGVERRETELDRREEALRRMQTEMQNAQREVLEMRLSTEETWAQLTGLLAPAALTKSIGKVRAELADHYGRTLDEITESRGELRDAADKLASEFEELHGRRIAMEEWANRRYEELAAVAERLEGREKELNRQQREFERHEAAWAAERDDYRDQIRTLLGELGEHAPLEVRAAA